MAIENLDPAAVTGGSALALVLAGFARKFYMDWMKGRPEAAAANAMDAQFKVLREQLTELQEDNKLLRLEFNKMDLKLHRQQTKLTRTEMLVRQFISLAKSWGKEVPDFMRDEINELILKDNEE